jgi:hypothetical protein
MPDFRGVHLPLKEFRFGCWPEDFRSFETNAIVRQQKTRLFPSQSPPFINRCATRASTTTLAKTVASLTGTISGAAHFKVLFFFILSFSLTGGDRSIGIVR